MKKIMAKLEQKSLNSYLKFRQGDVFLMVLGAALGAIILIAFFIFARDGVSSWGEAFTKLTSM